MPTARENREGATSTERLARRIEDAQLLLDYALSKGVAVDAAIINAVRGAEQMIPLSEAAVSDAEDSDTVESDAEDIDSIYGDADVLAGNVVLEAARVAVRSGDDEVDNSAETATAKEEDGQ